MADGVVYRYGTNNAGNRGAILAVNLTNRASGGSAASAVFDLPAEATGTTITVLGESRTITASGGQFTDSFPRFGCRRYTFPVSATPKAVGTKFHAGWWVHRDIGDTSVISEYAGEGQAFHNLAGSLSSTSQITKTIQYLDAAAAVGSKLTVALNSGYGPGQTHAFSPAQVVTVVNAIKAHSALAGYYIGDEPVGHLDASWFSPYYSAIKTADPDHPQYISFDLIRDQATLDKAVTYFPYLDVVGMHAYPVYAGSAEFGGGSMRMSYDRWEMVYQAALAAGKGFYATGQGFGGSSWRDPTLAEVEYQIFSAVVQGITTTMWWMDDYGDATMHSRVATVSAKLQEIAEEMNSAEDGGEEPPDPPVPTSGEIYIYGGKIQGSTANAASIEGGVLNLLVDGWLHVSGVEGGEAADPLAGDRAAFDAVNHASLHANDTDTSQAALHHTLGGGHTQAAPGDHTHPATEDYKVAVTENDDVPGYLSEKIGAGAGIHLVVNHPIPDADEQIIISIDSATQHDPVTVADTPTINLSLTGQQVSGDVIPGGIPIDTLGAASDNTNLNSSLTAHGLLPKLGGGSTNYLRADGTWAQPTGSHAAVTVADTTTVDMTLTGQEVKADVIPSGIKLDDLGVPDDNTDLNASTTRHGLTPKLDNTATHYLNGQGGWTTPATDHAAVTVADTTTVDMTLTGQQIKADVLPGGIKLDDFATPDDNTDLNAATTRHGLLPKLGGGTTNYLRADGTWAQPPGSHVAVTVADTTTVDLTLSGQQITADVIPGGIALDSLGGASDNTNLNAGLFSHGLLPKLSGDPTEFLSGGGTWITPPGKPGFVSAPFTSTSFDGDSFSTTAKTKIDLSASFSNGSTSIPAGVSAVWVSIAIRDSGSLANSCYIILSPNNNADSGMWFRCSGLANDAEANTAYLIPCDANGDIYIQVRASGTNTMDIWLAIWGYWL